MKDEEISFSVSEKIKSSFPIDLKEIKLFLLKIIDNYGINYRFINYYFTDDKEIKSYNITHLNHHYSTDIITFPHQYEPLEVDIIISLETVDANSKDYDSGFINELYRVIAHGILHCLGYNDSNENERKEMRLQEEICLSLHNVSRETN